eukprot:CAMPEP_0119326482 /NCGR_PEP_ID=MMETSP1333-20130426/68542_1 /TAXON_ID=418940 /ORGANISM="Scyphosphaera apsteinii, Strain RCC1455" /LENGTH=88 /DNA_ID=CAMNT_0007334803 /DNA_START=369 /DNA_END=635 /DNA_ORIENTATION=-
MDLPVQDGVPQIGTVKIHFCAVRRATTSSKWKDGDSLRHLGNALGGQFESPGQVEERQWVGLEGQYVRRGAQQQLECAAANVCAQIDK